MINVLIVGSGNIAQHYALALKAQKKLFSLHGNSLENSQRFALKHDITFTCEERNEIPDFASFTHIILAVPIECLTNYIEQLKEFPHLQILCEKPGFLQWSQMSVYENLTNVWFAFNRRFYSVVNQLKAMIDRDKFLSMRVIFDERIFQVEKSKKSETVKKHWILANSSHVIDLAFYLLDYDIKFNAFTFARSGSIQWHPTGRFFYASYLNKNMNLTFDSSWNGSGGWSIYIADTQCDYTLQPLERLTVTKNGEVTEYNENSPNKAGFEDMLLSFFGDKSYLMTPSQLFSLGSFIFRLGGYEKE
ncbi:hypothetical protein FJN14_04225 [Alteromonas mediterranea]|uniref:Gfo/Idh/MocA family oxidoreductase n=1 Tax=Alteromonas mediterranea TaxID=314275 RepID=UPI00113298CE|nr:Gfo/Idh/MocA family oxidoreductase [Alteromonas mediterranea]QDG37703.1 hypothetical protein FJN14_04225 [Alteromonas mediterranea]